MSITRTGRGGTQARVDEKIKVPITKNHLSVGLMRNLARILQHPVGGFANRTERLHGGDPAVRQIAPMKIFCPAK